MATTATEVKNNKQARRWCFTWNNYPDDTLIGEWLSNVGYSYYCIGKEIAPETGTPHLQGYIEFASGKRFETLKNTNSAIHWSICNGTQAQNQAYCKKGGKWYEGGTPGAQGTRNDLEEARQIILKGGTMLDVADNNFGSFIRYHKGFEKYQYLLQQKQAQLWRDVKVSYWWGDSGTGKTKLAFEEDPLLFRPMTGPTGVWWTGYQGQKTVLFDDFRGGVPIHVLLTWLDGYPIVTPIHCGGVQLTACRFIITSNVPLENLYLGVDEQTRQALRRRISDIRHFSQNATEATGNTIPSQKLGEYSPF